MTDVRAFIAQHRNAVIAGAGGGVVGLALLRRRKAKTADTGAQVATTYTPQATNDTTATDLSSQMQDGFSNMRDYVDQRNLTFADQLAALRTDSGTSPVGTTPGAPTSSPGGVPPRGPVLYPGGTPGGPPQVKLPPGTAHKPPTVIHRPAPAPTPAPPKGSPKPPAHVPTPAKTPGPAAPATKAPTKASPAKSSPAKKAPTRLAGSETERVLAAGAAAQYPLHKYGG